MVAVTLKNTQIGLLQPLLGIKRILLAYKFRFYCLSFEKIMV